MVLTDFWRLRWWRAALMVVGLTALSGCAFLNALEDPPEEDTPDSNDEPDDCLETDECPRGQMCDLDGRCAPIVDMPPVGGCGEVLTALPPGFVCVPGGQFTMGSPVGELGRDPIHEVPFEVTVTRAFVAQATEVTQAQWEAATGTQPSLRSGCGDCPVEQVNWWEALEYLNRRSANEGLESCYALTGCDGVVGAACVDCPEKFVCERVELSGLDCTGWRLPTEAEWELAARAGSRAAFYSGDITDETVDPALTAIAWYRPTSEGRSQPVGQLTANALGLFDVSGNVAEWVWSGHEVYPTGSQIDPLGPIDDAFRVVRGGGWNSAARDCRSAARGIGNPDLAGSDLGFRAVRTVAPQP